MNGLQRDNCEACDDCTFPGIRWPSMVGGDDTRQWIERCDACCLYESDQHAADELVKMIHLPVGQSIEFGTVTPVGSLSPTPYLTVYP